MTEEDREKDYVISGKRLEHWFKELIKNRDGETITDHRVQKYWDRAKDRGIIQEVEE